MLFGSSVVPYRYGSVGREHQTESDVRLPFFETTIKLRYTKESRLYGRDSFILGFRGGELDCIRDAG